MYPFKNLFKNTASLFYSLGKKFINNIAESPHSEESKCQLFNNILEPEERKSLDNRFPFSFIHLNL